MSIRHHRAECECVVCLREKVEADRHRVGFLLDRVDELETANELLRERNRKLRDAAREMLAACDEAYKATGYIRVSETSEQRISLASCLADHPEDSRPLITGE